MSETAPMETRLPVEGNRKGGQGPLEPMMPDGIRRRCHAHSSQHKGQCGRAVTPGHDVCASHGSKTKQARQKAALRLIELVDPAIATLAREMTNQGAKPGDRLRAAENVLDRAGYPRKLDTDTDTARQVLLQRLVEIRDGQDQQPESLSTQDPREIISADVETDGDE